MKKVFALLLALMLVASVAYAAPVYTVTSRDRYTDDLGVDVVRVRGTIAMDSTYGNNTTTARVGYALSPATIGMKSISQMRIEPSWAANVSGGTVISFRYTTAGKASDGTSNGSIRGYYTALASGVTAGGFASLPSYDLSDLTAVPFEAIGK
jgi:hypothetical protein